MASVVTTTVFLTDPADFQAMNEAYKEFFPDEPPARSPAKLGIANPGLKIAIEAIAVYEPKQEELAADSTASFVYALACGVRSPRAGFPGTDSRRRNDAGRFRGVPAPAAVGTRGRRGRCRVRPAGSHGTRFHRAATIVLSRAPPRALDAIRWPARGSEGGGPRPRESSLPRVAGDPTLPDSETDRTGKPRSPPHPSDSSRNAGGRRCSACGTGTRPAGRWGSERPREG